MLKKLLVNFLVALGLFGILEFISYLYLRHTCGDYLTDTNNYAKEHNLPLWTMRYAPVRMFHSWDEGTEEHYRPVKTGNTGESILFFGCSYIYGFGEKEENTIPYILNQKTGITTVNRGYPGGGYFEYA